MNNAVLPLIIEPVDLEKNLQQRNLRIVDLCKADIYPQAHIPGAVHLDYGKIIRQEKPAMGLLPTEHHMSEVLSSLGISPDTHVVAYDDEGGGKACRFLWTLAVIGHKHYSLLNGGLHSWANEGHEVDNTPVSLSSTTYDVSYDNGNALADMDYILQHLQDNKLSILDCRSPQEYKGEKKLGGNAGHIPHAVNMDWTRAIDQENNYRMKQAGAMEPVLSDLGITNDKEVIVYCHTHHRSAHTYIMLKSLGYENVKAYPGSWSEWGNTPDLPVEV